VLSATKDLCDVPWFADEWQATGELYDTIKVHWDRVAERLSGFTGTF
jgi:hypothetical protein